MVCFMRMAELFHIVMLRVCLAILAAIAAVVVFVWLRHVCRWLIRQLTPSMLAVFALIAAYTATVAQKGGRGGGTGTPEAPPGMNGNTGVLNLTDESLYFSDITVDANTVALAVRWPPGFCGDGTTIDLVSATSLVHSVWTWQNAHVVSAGETNWDVTVAREGNARFFKAVLRDSLTDMDDPDGDGLPNVYELHHGKNPWVADYASVSKLTVGEAEGDIPTIAAALARSGPYSVIEIAPGEYAGSGWSGVPLPGHPVLVTASGTRPVIRSDAFATFLLPYGTTEQTVLRNLCIDLGGRGGLRVGFWCGGNLPWSGMSSSATFEDVYVRMPNPDAHNYGWIFYRASTNRSVLTRCAVNASGARHAMGVFAIDPPPLVLENCTFPNFPSNSISTQGVALYLETTLKNYGGVLKEIGVDLSRAVFDESFTNALPLARFERGTNFFVRMESCLFPRTPLEHHAPDVLTTSYVMKGQMTWSGFPLVGSVAAMQGLGAFLPVENDPAVDTDDDGLYDYDEIYSRGTDPFLADSDGDGIPDCLEIRVGTSPTDPYSFKPVVTVVVTNTATLEYPVRVAWGCSQTGWDENGLACFANGFGTTNYVDIASQGAAYVKAYCDLNGNNEYDAAHDILLVRAIPPGSTPRISFCFGDVDEDGVSDEQERQEETDPYDDKNFRLVTTVNLESTDVATWLTNRVAWGFFPISWEMKDTESFTGASLEYLVDGVATNGELFVKVYRDLNTNGVYDAGVDAYVTNRLTRMDNGKEVTFKIGDSDRDGVGDSVEIGEGTNPLSKLDYCFNLSLTYTGVFQTTNALTFEASFGADRVYGPTVVEGKTWTYDFGHRVATMGEKVFVNVWDDANHNGSWDADETRNLLAINVTGHDMVVTNTLPYASFDRNYNEIPDWWEVQEGLDAEGVARRAYDDPDGDGLINLHEFWCGTHPLVPDGSNTLLSVAARSIDRRIWGVDPLMAVSRFTDFDPDAAVNLFTLNENFWARDLDLSCVSVWNDGSYPDTQAATLITRKHVVMANHWWNNGEYTFCDTNGQICTRSIVRWDRISDDLQLGQLDVGLPETFKPASVMSTNYVRYLSTGRYLPTLCLNQKKGATVLELEDFNCRVLEEGGRWHNQYGKNSMTNYVSEQRKNIRGTTPGGNSGCPVFLVVGNDLVLLFSKHLGSHTEDRWCRFWGPMLPFRIDAIQNKINEWEGSDAGQYQLVPLNLSVYPELVNER